MHPCPLSHARMHRSVHERCVCVCVCVYVHGYVSYHHVSYHAPSTRARVVGFVLAATPGPLGWGSVRQLLFAY